MRANGWHVQNARDGHHNTQQSQTAQPSTQLNAHLPEVQPHPKGSSQHLHGFGEGMGK